MPHTHHPSPTTTTHGRRQVNDATTQLNNTHRAPSPPLPPAPPKTHTHNHTLAGKPSCRMSAAHKGRGELKWGVGGVSRLASGSLTLRASHQPSTTPGITVRHNSPRTHPIRHGENNVCMSLHLSLMLLQEGCLTASTWGVGQVTDRHSPSRWRLRTRNLPKPPF